MPSLCLLPLLVALLAGSSIASTQLPKPLQDLRAADGHYLARDDGEPSPADQRVNVWMLLSRIADGSTLRTGPHRKEITQLVTGGQQLRAHEQRIDADLVAKVVPRGERAGELPPRGAFGDAHGRVGTTATATLTIAVRHRYVRLHLFE